MKKHSKRILSLLMAVILCASLCVVPVAAADDASEAAIAWSEDFAVLTVSGGTLAAESLTAEIQAHKSTVTEIILGTPEAPLVLTGSADSMCRQCTKLTAVDLSNVDMSAVTSVRYMFYGCTNLQSVAASGLNLGSVTTAYGMFYDCSNLKAVDISHWDLHSVTSIAYMFYNCRALTHLDFSNWVCPNLTSIHHLLSQCRGLESGADELDMTGLDVSRVTDFTRVFHYCFKIDNVNVSNWDTANATTMSHLFANCYAMSGVLDLSSFNTKKVRNMEWMFYDDRELTAIYVGDGWDITAALAGGYSTCFYHNAKLVGGNGTEWNDVATGNPDRWWESKAVLDYAVVDLSADQVGLLSAHVAQIGDTRYARLYDTTNSKEQPVAGAISAVPMNQPTDVKMLMHWTEPSFVISAGKQITLDLNGVALTLSNAPVIRENMTINDSGDNRGAVILPDGSLAVQNGKTLVVNGGSFTLGENADVLFDLSDGKLVINNGIFTGALFAQGVSAQVNQGYFDDAAKNSLDNGDGTFRCIPARAEFVPSDLEGYWTLEIPEIVFTPSFSFRSADFGGNNLPGTEFVLVNREETEKIVKAMVALGAGTFENLVGNLGSEGFTWDDLNVLNQNILSLDAEAQQISFNAEQAHQLLLTYWKLLEASAAEPVQNFLGADLRLPAILRATADENGIVTFSEDSNVTLVWSLEILFKMADSANRFLADAEVPENLFQSPTLQAVVEVTRAVSKLAAACGDVLVDADGHVIASVVNDYLYPLLMDDGALSAASAMFARFVPSGLSDQTLSLLSLLPTHGILTEKMPDGHYIMFESAVPEGYFRSPLFYTVVLQKHMDDPDPANWCTVSVANLGIIAPYYAENLYTLVRSTSLSAQADKLLNELTGGRSGTLIQNILTGKVVGTGADYDLTALAIAYQADVIYQYMGGKEVYASEAELADALNSYLYSHGRTAQNLMMFGNEVMLKTKSVITGELTPDWTFYTASTSLCTNVSLQAKTVFQRIADSIDVSNGSKVLSIAKDVLNDAASKIDTTNKVQPVVNAIQEKAAQTVSSVTNSVVKATTSVFKSVFSLFKR